MNAKFLFVLIALWIILLGCSNTNTPVIPTLSPVKTLGLDTLEKVYVVRVIDGDTIPKSFPIGTYGEPVIVLGVNTIESSPPTFARFLSLLVNNKSPCSMPLIPNDGKYFNATFNLSANAPP